MLKFNFKLGKGKKDKKGSSELAEFDSNILKKLSAEQLNFLKTALSQVEVGSSFRGSVNTPGAMRAGSRKEMNPINASAEGGSELFESVNLGSESTNNQIENKMRHKKTKRT